MRSLLLSLSLALLVPACAATASDETAAGTTDDLVAVFNRQGITDLSRTTHLMIVGDSAHLGELPLHAATTMARRYAELYPGDQIILFVTKDVSAASVGKTGATVIKREGLGETMIAELATLDATTLTAAMDRFTSIASIDFFGHSSPFGALLEDDTPDRVLAPPAELASLADNFARDRHPYVTLNGCNGGVETAAKLSKLWKLPVSGALSASNFEAPMSDGRWYPNDDGRAPPGVTKVSTNRLSFGASAPACSDGACIRMKPENAPYFGVWSQADGFQYGLNYYKFFCDYADPAETCAKGMATSLLSRPSTKAVDLGSSDEDLDEVLADFFCNASKDATWFDRCKTNLFAAAESGAPFSPMKGANDRSLECDFSGCAQKFRCEMSGGVPQKGTCAWVSADCRASQPASACKPKNTKLQTTTAELRRYQRGLELLRGR
ncbi:MAG: hypothetical protein U0270_34900 [Labilithrix sp.]